MIHRAKSANIFKYVGQIFFLLVWTFIGNRCNDISVQILPKTMIPFRVNFIAPHGWWRCEPIASSYWSWLTAQIVPLEQLGASSSAKFPHKCTPIRSLQAEQRFELMNKVSNTCAVSYSLFVNIFLSIRHIFRIKKTRLNNIMAMISV